MANFNLKRYSIEKLFFEHHSIKNQLSMCFNYEINFDLKRDSLSEAVFKTQIENTSEDAKNNGDILKIELQVTALFECKGIKEGDTGKTYEQDIFQQIFPYISSIVTNITTMSCMSPLFIPNPLYDNDE